METNEHNSRGNPAMDNHPRGVLGNRNTSSCFFHALKSGDRRWPDAKWSTRRNCRLKLLRFTPYTSLMQFVIKVLCGLFSFCPKKNFTH